ncbi:MAG: hypothetical protein F4Z31_12330 [Gemmatimonadetes bacterium]|nr:hypothetical protein [Gemmatimonadota bacterium]MYA42529.1 hypothetical protein [Gemmatimonadota bacterium]MYE93789.1 hypothetical protein [Gemmatimonadota bacterium]MYJ10492.1 hypothetical protein [Gemmatimonadota bacterium]
MRILRKIHIPVLALLGLSILACDQVEPSVPTCSIVGHVSIDGVGIDGLVVTLDNGDSTTSAGGGHFHFDNVEGPSVTLAISGLPSNAAFDHTLYAVTVAPCDGTVTINFSGSYSHGRD